MSGSLVTALSNDPNRFAGGYVFKNSLGGPTLDADDFVRDWTDALEATRITYRRPYTCRHTRASEMLMAGVEPAFAAAQLGHSLEMFFKTYAHWINGAKDEDQKKLLSALAGL
jgi:integrase